MRILDLCCGAGGAAMGYHRAGFEVLGVDNVAQPRYPFEFRQADALHVATWANVARQQYDAVHASPPCQHYANVTRWKGDQESHVALIEPLRELLDATGLPYVIENVRTTALRNPLVLCGSMFGLRVRRHRYFEANWPLSVMSPYGCDHRNLLPFEHKGERAYTDAMGCEWMTSMEARQAIPPAYTEYIGALLMDHVLYGEHYREPLAARRG